MKRLWRLALALLLACAWVPAPQAAAATCSDAAELVETELDPADGMAAPDDTITVVWTVRNAGDCTWGRDYRLLFIGGDRLDGSRTARLRTTVAPGATLALNLDLTAPAEPGDYAGTWRLRGPDGATFGPDLTVAIQVGDAVASGEVVLPEVLAFGGMGGGGADDTIDPCVDADGFLLSEPGIALDAAALSYRYAYLYVCGFAEGSELTVTVTNPNSEVFSRTYTVEAAHIYTDGVNSEYAQTWVSASLRWPEQAPNGSWRVDAGDGETEVTAQLEIMEPEPIDDSTFVTDFPSLDNYPNGPIDPFAAAQGCNYAYTAGAAMVIEGRRLPPNASLHLALYAERMFNAYLMTEQIVTSTADGTLYLTYTAPQPGTYHLMLINRVDPSGYLEDNTTYFAYFGDDSASSCFTVSPRDDNPIPWRLAVVEGEPGSATVSLMSMESGSTLYNTYLGDCDAMNPAWWPDGLWLLYASNCVEGEPDPETGWVPFVAGSYDLYAHETRFGEHHWSEEGEAAIQLTATPELDETDPAASVDGYIVYRQAPAGTPVEESGALWLLDVETGESTDLGLIGRAPAWSPDGTQLAFMSDVEGAWQVYVYDLEQETFWPVDTRCPSVCRFPAWSPDGRELIYSSTVSDSDLTPNALWVAPAAGGRARRLLTGVYDQPTWTEEGWIGFSGPDGFYRIADDAAAPEPERFLYVQPDLGGPLREPVWSR